MRTAILLLVSINVWGVNEARMFSWIQDAHVKKGVRNLPWVRDPFYPTEQRFKLNGIISGELAFINGKWFRQGDSIQGYRVKMVTQDSVALMKDGEIINLRLGE